MLCRWTAVLIGAIGVVGVAVDRKDRIILPYGEGSDRNHSDSSGKRTLRTVGRHSFRHVIGFVKLTIA